MQTKKKYFCELKPFLLKRKYIIYEAKTCFPFLCRFIDILDFCKKLHIQGGWENEVGTLNFIYFVELSDVLNTWDLKL